MPSNFNRFRALNQTASTGNNGHAATNVTYAGFSDRAGTTIRLAARSPVDAASPLPPNSYIGDSPPAGADTVDIASLRIMRIQMANGATLTNWLLPCPDAVTTLVELDLVIMSTAVAGNYMASAELFFDTGTAVTMRAAVDVPQELCPDKEGE